MPVQARSLPSSSTTTTECRDPRVRVSISAPSKRRRVDKLCLFLSLFKYGYLGVELFFIVSGFVILLTALNRSAREFVVSRGTRLYPAFWTCVTITFLAILTIGGSRYSATWPQYLANLTMLQEFMKI